LFFELGIIAGSFELPGGGGVVVVGSACVPVVATEVLELEVELECEPALLRGVVASAEEQPARATPATAAITTVRRNRADDHARCARRSREGGEVTTCERSW
jgi:hypothetical protein